MAPCSHLGVSCFESQFANKPIHVVSNARNEAPALARSDAAQVAWSRTVVVLRVHQLPKLAHVVDHGVNFKFGTLFRDAVVCHEVCEALVQPDVVGFLICEVLHVRGPVLELAVVVALSETKLTCAVAALREFVLEMELPWALIVPMPVPALLVAAACFRLLLGGEAILIMV